MIDTAALGIAPGIYYLIARTDSDNDVDEAFIESNNIRISPQPLTVGYPDLDVTFIGTPRVVEKGNPLEITAIIQNRGEAPAGAASWIDEVFINSTNAFDGNETSVGTFEHTGGLGVEDAYTIDVSVDTTGLTDGMYYVLVNTDKDNVVFEDSRESNNGQVSDRATTVGTPVLTLGDPLAGTLNENGSSLYYRVSVPAGEVLSINLDDADNEGHNELYVKVGVPPTRSDFDAQVRQSLLG